MSSVDQLRARLAALGNNVRALKSGGAAEKHVIDAAVAELLDAKAALAGMLTSMIDAIGVEAKEELRIERDALLPKSKAAVKAAKVAAKASTKESGPEEGEFVPNPLQWDDTPPLPILVCDAIEHYLAIAAKASGFDALPSSLRQEVEASRTALERLLSASVFASVKLDGTCVGKEASAGQLVGRRFRIRPDACEYQHSSLEPLVEVDAARVRALLAAALPNARLSEVPCATTSPASARSAIAIGELTVYGELVCNPYYGYTEAGLFRTWRAFGVVFEVVGDAEEAVASLVSAGWPAALCARESAGGALPADGGGSAAAVAASPSTRVLPPRPPAVRLLASPKLFRLLRSAAIPTAEVVAPSATAAAATSGSGIASDGSAEGCGLADAEGRDGAVVFAGLSALVASCQPRLLAQRDEGLVLTLMLPQHLPVPLPNNARANADVPAAHSSSAGACGPAAGGAFIAKWKISAEFQPRAVERLRALAERLDVLEVAASADGATHALPAPAPVEPCLPTGSAELVRSLLAVATAPLSPFFRATTGAAAPDKYLKPKHKGSRRAREAGGDRADTGRAAKPAAAEAPATAAATDMVAGASASAVREAAKAAVREALASAMTKLPSLREMFSAGEAPCVVARQLLAEMQNDLRASAAQGGQAEAMVIAHVGHAYGVWKHQAASQPTPVAHLG